MVSFWGSSSAADLVAMGSQIGANLTAYEDRERRIKREDAADKRAEAEEARTVESHDLAMKTKRREENRAEMLTNVAQAKSALKRGDREGAMRYAAKANEYDPNGQDIVEMKDMTTVGGEEKALAKASNPEMAGIIDSDVAVKVHSRFDDRLSHVGGNLESMLDDMLAGAQPEAFLRKEAEQQARMDQLNMEATPQFIPDEEGGGEYFIDLAVDDGKGGYRKTSKALTAEEAKALNPGAFSAGQHLAKKNMRDVEKERLDMQKTRAEIGYKGAQTQKAYADMTLAERKAAAASKTNVTDTMQNNAYKALEDYLFPAGRTDVEIDPAARQQKLNLYTPFLRTALEKNGGDIAKAPQDAMKLYDESVSRRQQYEARKAKDERTQKRGATSELKKAATSGGYEKKPKAKTRAEKLSDLSELPGAPKRWKKVGNRMVETEEWKKYAKTMLK